MFSGVAQCWSGVWFCVGGSAGAGAGAGGAQMGWAHSYQLTLTAHSLGWPACVMFLFYQILILTTP